MQIYGKNNHGEHKESMKKSIIDVFCKWYDSYTEEIPRHLTRQILQLNAVKDFCVEFPTCEGCPFYKKYVGCIFRGKTPREW